MFVTSAQNVSSATLSTRTDFKDTKAFIFVVDSNDRDRVLQARLELHRMLNEDDLRNAAFVLFANKQDLPNVMDITEVRDKLGISGFLPNRTWSYEATSASSGQGLRDGVNFARLLCLHVRLRHSSDFPHSYS